MLEFETFYPQNPFKPIWMKGYHDEILRQRFAKNVSNFDLLITELLKKIFGFKKAMKLQVCVTNNVRGSWGYLTIFCERDEGPL